MYLPNGYKFKNKIYKLWKDLYGLKQAPLKWNLRFAELTKTRGFESLKTEQCLSEKKNSTMMLNIYVDNGIVIGDNWNDMQEILKGLKRAFELTIFEKPKIFVGMEIKKEEGGIKVTQLNYIKEMLQEYGMDNAKSFRNADT